MRFARAIWIAACTACVLVLFTASSANASEKRTGVDSAGRRVVVPASVARIFVAGGPASVFMYSLAPEKLLGWNRQLTPESARIFRADMPIFLSSDVLRDAATPQMLRPC